MRYRSSSGMVVGVLGFLQGEEEIDQPLSVLGDILHAQLGVSKETVDEGNGYFSDREAELARANDHFHLESVSL